METVSPSERYRWELEESLGGTGQHEYPIELIDRLAARLISQQGAGGGGRPAAGSSGMSRAEKVVAAVQGSVEVHSPFPCFAI